MLLRSKSQCVRLKSYPFTPPKQLCPYLFCSLEFHIHSLLYEERIELLTLMNLYSRRNAHIRIAYSNKYREYQQITLSRNYSDQLIKNLLRALVSEVTSQFSVLCNLGNKIRMRATAESTACALQ